MTEIPLWGVFSLLVFSFDWISFFLFPPDLVTLVATTIVAFQSFLWHNEIDSLGASDSLSHLLDVTAMVLEKSSWMTDFLFMSGFRGFVVASWPWQRQSVWSWGNVAGPLGVRIWHVNYQFNYLNMTSYLCFPNWSESCFKYFSFTRGGRGWGGVFYILLHLFLLLFLCIRVSSLFPPLFFWNLPSPLSFLYLFGITGALRFRSASHRFGPFLFLHSSPFLPLFLSSFALSLTFF